jgi:hypothetical protein
MELLQSQEMGHLLGKAMERKLRKEKKHQL